MIMKANRKENSRGFGYSRLIDILGAAAVILIVCFLFYFLFLRGTHYLFDLKNRQNYQIKYQAKLTTKGKESVDATVTVWKNGDSYLFYKETTRGVLYRICNGSEVLESSDGEIFVKSDRGLHPFPYPYAPEFGSFIFENRDKLPSSSVMANQTIMGRNCRHVVFYNPINIDERYEVWIDIERGVPLQIIIENSDGVVLEAKPVSFEIDKQKPEEFEAFSELNSTKTVDILENARVSPAFIETKAGFTIYPPIIIPRDLSESSYLVFEEKKESFPEIDAEGKIVFLSYYSEDKFLKLYEYNGKEILFDTNQVFKEKFKDTTFTAVAGPGYFIGKMKINATLIVIESNLSYERFKKSAASCLKE